MSTSTLTLTAPAPTQAPTLPDLDPAVGDQLGDDILLSAARSTKVAKVQDSGGRRFVGSAVRSHTARAWSAGGNVD